MLSFVGSAELASNTEITRRAASARNEEVTMRAGSSAASTSRLTRLFERRPFLACIGILLLGQLIWGLLPSITVVLFAKLLPALGDVRSALTGLPRAAAGAFWAGLVLFTAWRILENRDWARLVGFNLRWRQPWLVWVLALYVVLNLSSLLGKTLRMPDWQPLLQAVLQAPSGALFEEAIYRGLMLAILLSRFHKTRAEVLTAVLFSSALFGLAHAWTLSSPDIPWQHGVANIVYATFAGVGYSAVLLRTRNIWLVAGVHTGHRICELAPRPAHTRQRGFERNACHTRAGNDERDRLNTSLGAITTLRALVVERHQQT